MKRFAILIALCVTASYSARGVVESTPTPPPAAVLAADNQQVFDPAAATKAWLDTVPAEDRAKSDAYFEGGYWLLLWDFLLNTAIVFVLLNSGFSAALRDWTERVTGSRSLQVVLYAIPFVTITAVLTLPLAIYEGFFREHKYGMATQDFGAWFGDQLKGFIIALIVVPIILIVLYAVFRRAKRTWWIWGTIVAVLFSVLGNIIAPVFIFPLFNKYTPLTEPKIRDPILAMARANQIPVDQVFVVDASKQTTRVSANVAGLLGTTRIALNDNLLNQCALPEIREVMAHEMGHFVLNHGMKLTTYSAISFLVAFGLLNLFFNAAVAIWGEQWGVRGIADIAGLPLIVLIFSILIFVSTPISNTVIRVTEREADAFALNAAREPDATASIALKLGKYRKLDPGPIEEFVFFDHPSGRARIRMAMDWKAAQLSCGQTQ